MRGALMVGAAVVCCAATLRADVSFAYVTDTPVIAAAAGQTVHVQLFLEEHVTGVSASLLEGEDGLAGAGLTVERRPGPSDPAQITAMVANTTAFDGAGTTSVSPTAGLLLEAVSPSTMIGARPVHLGAGVRRVYLGAVTVQMGHTVGEATELTIGPALPAGNTLTFQNRYDLDVTSMAPPYVGATSSSVVLTTMPAGACCLDGGTCTDQNSQSDCDAAGGIFFEGQTCLQAVCPPLGACCTGSECWDDVLQPNCEAVSGIFHAGLTCADALPLCPHLGACCWNDGSGCGFVNDAACAGYGRFHPGVYCADVTCTEIVVNPGESIQAAINAALPGDVIIVEAGRYSEALDLTGKAVTLRSRRGPSTTILDGSSLAGAVVRCVTGEGTNTIIEGFTITGGTGASEYTPSRGGGMLVRCSSPTIRNCIFEENQAGGIGGGLYIAGQALNAFDCVAAPVVEACEFRRNHAAAGAGAAAGLSDAFFDRCSLLGNTASDRGGALLIAGGNAALANSVIVGNTAARGAGLYAQNDGAAPASLAVLGCTFTANIADVGGAVESTLPLVVSNSILWGDAPGELVVPGSATISSSDVQGGWTGPGNVALDPFFWHTPAPGQDGLWGTIDDDYGDLHLRPGSPCIDRGNTASAIFPADVRGCPRAEDDPATPDLGAGSPPLPDIGAVEFRPPLVVDPSGSNGFQTIQAAVAASEPCDDIHVRSGTYEESLDIVDRRLAIRSVEGPGLARLSGDAWGMSIERSTLLLDGLTLNGTDSEPHPYHDSRAAVHDTRLVLAHCAITDEHSLAGAMYATASDVAVLSCVIRDCAPAGGGVISSHGGTLTIIGTHFLDNVATDLFNGGVCVDADDCAVVIAASAFSGSAGDFGPVLTRRGTLGIDGCTFVDNFSFGSIVLLLECKAQVAASTFLHNTMWSYQAAVALYNSGAVIHDCTLVDNIADLGGALFIGGAASQVLVRQSVFEGNHGFIGGGAVLIEDGACRLEESLFAANGGFEYGGGAVLLFDGSCRVSGSLFTENEAPCGGALWIDDSASPGSMIVQTSTFRRNFPSHIDGPFDDGGGNVGLSYTDWDGDGDVDVFDLIGYINFWFAARGDVVQLLGFVDCWFTGDPQACYGSPGPCP